MIRFEGDPPDEASPPPAAAEEGDGTDSLFERWLTRFPASQQRMRAAAAVEPEREPLGDDLADRWFRR